MPSALSWVFKAGESLAVGPYCPWQNSRTVAAGSVVVFILFCNHESVFPLHPLINYWPDLVGSHFI